MRTQFTTNLSHSRTRIAFVCAALSGLAGTSGSAWGAAPDPSTPSAAYLSTNWLDQVINLIDALYILIGGDPAAIDRSATATVQANSLIAYFNGNGIPNGMNSVETSFLIADIHDLYEMTLSPEVGISADTLAALRVSLQKMWVSLGLSASDL